MLKWRFELGLVFLLSALLPQPAAAIPLFARQYGVTCGKCHSVIPHLNEFGAAFLASGDRIPGVQPGAAFPISAKVNLVDSSANLGSGPDGAGLPKAIVDEIELFTAGAIGSRASYLVEQYVVDGGEPGLLHDAWVTDRLNPWSARIPVYVQGGQFTLPLPVDPETFRDTFQDYTPYTLTVGANPFNFKDPKMGLRAQFGDSLRGLSLQLFGGPGYDRGSELPKTGVDTMVYGQDAMGPFTLSIYRYAGLRLLAGTVPDRFERTGYGFTYGQWTRFSSEFVLENGWDTDCAVAGHTGCSSSGGFEQLRYAFTRRLFAEARYEGTSDPSGFTRDAVLLLGYGPSENSRATIEDVITHSPLTSNTMNAQFSIAY
ncbi:MAG TPA: hypothetical protein VIW73_00570 [Candidatus Cybelea sp.]